MDQTMHLQKREVLKQIQEDNHHALRIAVCGKFKSGKSSLLNLLLGTDLPVKAVTATGIVTKVIYGKACAVKINSGKIQYVSRQDLYDYISVAEKSLEGVVLSDAQCAYVGSKAKILHRGKVEFWDTPGLEDDPTLSAITMDAIQQCDFLVYVMAANQVLSAYEKRMFPKLNKLMNGNMIFAINHMDELREDESSALITMVKNALKDYSTPYITQGSIYFTSANPSQPEISDLQLALCELCGAKKTRLAVLNSTKIGKAAVLEEEWQESILQDEEESVKRKQDYQGKISANIAQKKQSLEALYKNCHNTLKRSENQLNTELRDESSWRRVLIDYQSGSGWEKTFKSSSEIIIKGRMAQLINSANLAVRDSVAGSVFESDISPISLNERFVWKKANWYKNFSKPLLFPEKRFKQYSFECVDVCIKALMANPVQIVLEQSKSFFSSINDTILAHYQKEMATVTAAPELLNGFDQANSDIAILLEYRNYILKTQADISSGRIRKKLSYTIKEFFSFFFPGLLADEVYK